MSSGSQRLAFVEHVGRAAVDNPAHSWPSLLVLEVACVTVDLFDTWRASVLKSCN
jgi:hypothetical protein